MIAVMLEAEETETFSTEPDTNAFALVHAFREEILVLSLEDELSARRSAKGTRVVSCQGRGYQGEQLGHHDGITAPVAMR